MDYIGYMDELKNSILNNEIISVSQLDKLYNNIKNLNIRQSNFVGKYYIDLIFNLIYDYNHKYYEDIEKKNINTILISLLYFILPNKVIEPIIGKHSMIKNLVAIGFSMRSLYAELDKYSGFLKENEVEITTDFGIIKYYRHRFKAKDGFDDV